MRIFSFSSQGYDGVLVEIEINILARSLPGIEIVGLPGSAVKESKVRFRSAILNSGFDFPKGRVIINMAPAGEKKEGACFDLPFACRVLSLSRCIKNDFLIIGELTLSGEVLPVNGVLSAIVKGVEAGIDHFIIPYNNKSEALILGYGNIYPVKNLNDAVKVLNNDVKPHRYINIKRNETLYNIDFKDIKGQAIVKRALEIVAAGGHNILLFGPPGVGKTLSVNRLCTIIPDFTKEEALETTRVWSMAGKLTKDEVIVQKPPIRRPHHGASFEGLIGGGKNHMPGEISLAHNGYLFMDEIPEFKSSILQSLREPLEDKVVSLSRASVSTWYPANFKLIATANPCPCGNLGKEDSICLCSEKEIRKYWKKMGGAIMDRIDIRVPVKPVSIEKMLDSSGDSSEIVKKRVLKAVNIQKNRYKNYKIRNNSEIPAGEVSNFCPLDEEVRLVFIEGVKKLSLSSRGSHSVLKISRTISDIDGDCEITKDAILEAFSYRRYGDEDYYFS